MKKGKSQMAAFLVASVLAAGFLTGCGGSNAESDSVSQQQESASVGEKETGDEDYSQDVITYGMTQRGTRLIPMDHPQDLCIRILYVTNCMTVLHL